MSTYCDQFKQSDFLCFIWTVFRVRKISVILLDTKAKLSHKSGSWASGWKPSFSAGVFLHLCLFHASTWQWPDWPARSHDLSPIQQLNTLITARKAPPPTSPLPPCKCEQLTGTRGDNKGIRVVLHKCSEAVTCFGFVFLSVCVCRNKLCVSFSAATNRFTQIIRYLNVVILKLKQAFLLS